MKEAEFIDLVRAGEGEQIEFKSENVAPEIVARVVCAFLNHRGGRVILGVGDDGKLLGVRDATRIVDQLRRVLQASITPSALWTIDEAAVAGKDFIIIEIPEGMDKPYVANGAIYYSRKGGRVIPATRDEISDLILKRVDAGHRWERQFVVGASLQDLDSGLIAETAQMSIKAERWQGDPSDRMAFLHSFGLFENGGITNAALVLFGVNPARWLPQARVRLMVMQHDKAGDRHSVDRTFESNLLQLAQRIPEALSTYVGGVASSFSEHTWQRNERVLYPGTALREGVLNALVHRDYARTGSILISVRPKSITITNPGGLPDELKPSDLKRNHSSVPRNPDIAHICYLRKLIEKIGRGTQRIVEDCRTAKMKDPKWESSAFETSLHFFTPSRTVVSTDIKDLSDRQQRILKTLNGKGSLKTLNIAESLGGGVTDRTIRNDLLALIDGGWIVRRGQGPSSRYVVADKAS